MQNPTLDTVRRILAELANTAEHASLTRSLGGGEKAAARAFNGALATLTSQGLVPEGMFESMSLDDADYGSLGVQARLLLACLEDEPSPKRRRRDRDGASGEGLGAVVALAPFLDSGDLAQMLRERIDETVEVPDHLLTSLAPFLDSGDLGELVRRRMRPRPPQAPTMPAAPDVPFTPSTLQRPDLRPVAVSEAPVTLESLATELRRPDLSIVERQRIAMRLADLSYEQSVRAME